MRAGATLFGVLLTAGLVGGGLALPSCGGDSQSQTQPDAGAGGGITDGGTGGNTTGECLPAGAANELSSDDPNWEGQCIFLFDAWGTEVHGDWPPTAFMLDLMTSEPDVFGNQFEKFGFLPDPNDNLPIGLKRGLTDPTAVHETCAMCHTAKLPDGRIWFGAPNGSLDIGRFKVEVDKRWVAAGHPSLMSPLSETKALALGPGRFNAESSDYPYVVPADYPPYFMLSKRTHLNYIGTGDNLRTEAYFAIYSFGAGSPNAQTAKVPFPPDDKVNTFLAFFGKLEAPVGPAQDAALVAQGKAVFDAAKCGSCHHPDDIGLDEVVTYDKDPNGLERLPGDDPAFPRGSIRTDIMHRVLIDTSVGPDAGVDPDAGMNPDSGVDTGYADLIKFIFDHGLSVTQTDGYRTSDLHGLWATAPYLHNGSVPTLEDLLKAPASRPEKWMRDGFLVDTTMLANSNEGHEFGTTLSDTDKQALVAYLKSL